METVFLALRVLLSLGAVLVAIWWVHRRLTKGGRMPRAAKTVNVVTKQSISAKASVVVMDVDGQRFLLGVTEQSVTVLNTSETPEPEDSVVPPVAAPRPTLHAAAAPHVRPAAPARAAAAPARPATPHVRPVGGAAFARVLAEAQESPEAEYTPAPLVHLPEPRTTPLDGSILSAATWKRTAAVLRRAR